MQNKLKRLSALLLAVIVIVLTVPVISEASSFEITSIDLDKNSKSNFTDTGNSNLDAFGKNLLELKSDDSWIRDRILQPVNYISQNYEYYVFLREGGSYPNLYIYASHNPFYLVMGSGSCPAFYNASDSSYDFDIYCIYSGSDFSYSIDDYSKYASGSSSPWNSSLISKGSMLLWGNIPCFNGAEINSLGVSPTFASIKDNFENGNIENCNIYGYVPPRDYASGGALDESLGLTQFTLHPVYDNRYVSNFGLSFQYAFNEAAQTLLSDGGKLNVEYTIQCRYKETNSNYVSPLITLTNQQLYDIRSDNCETVSLESLLLKANIKSGATSDNDVYTISSLFQVLSGMSVEGWSISSKSFSSGISFNITSLFTISENNTTTSTSTVNTYEFTTFTVTAYAVGTNGIYHTNRRTSSVDLVQGTNTHYNNIGDDTAGYYPDTSDYVSNSNYFTYDNDSNTYNYYNSVTNETKSVGESPTVTMGDIIVNVDVSGGGGGSMIQNNNVTFPDSIKIFIESHLPDSEPNVTIEDDDLTDVSLRDDLADGFGFLDDASTPEKSDGYIAMVSDFYSGIDPHFKDLIMFGVSTTVGVAILRMIFKR